MIKLHRLNKKEFVLNAEVIRNIESTPDTLITLIESKDKLMVLESVEEVLAKVIEYKRSCFIWPLTEERES